MTPDRIAKELRKLIETSPASRYRIAQETGLTQATLSRFVNDEDRGISLEAASKLAAFFDREVVLRKRSRR